MRVTVATLVALFCTIATLTKAQAPQTQLVFENDGREEIRIVRFGFLDGGYWNVSLYDFQVHELDSAGLPGDSSKNSLQGLIFRRATTLAATTNDQELCSKTESMITDDAQHHTEFYPINVTEWHNETFFSNGTEGLWTITMMNCVYNTRISFRFVYQMVNPGPNYLSAGEQALPQCLGWLAVVFIALAVIWVGVLTCSRDRRVLWPHWVMLALLFLKSLTLGLDAMKYQSRQLGVNSNGWAISYYVFFFLKGSLHFSILLLIATGWVFVKPYLTNRDKIVFAIVLPLQAVSNIAYIIMSETSESSQLSSFWRILFPVIDIVCCFIVFMPIVQTKQYIAESDTDGKLSSLRHKYKLWGRLYLIVFSYIYVTRVVVQLMLATVHYEFSWTANMFEEVSTFCFYLFIGYSFRPVIDNPYFEVKLDDDDDFEEIPLETFGRLKKRDLSEHDGGDRVQID